MSLKSSIAVSITFLSFTASGPKPMLRVTLVILGTAILDLKPKDSFKFGTAFSR